MRRSMKTVAIAAALVFGLAAAPALYANPAHHTAPAEGSDGSMMGEGGMMGMMAQMGQMMASCNQMMQGMADGSGTGRPNEQWKKKQPATPEARG